MKSERVDEINKIRLFGWRKQLTKQHSTPVMLVGVGHDHNSGQVTLLVTEEMNDQEILLFLKKSYDMALEKYGKNN